MSETPCVFCAIASGEAPGHILWRDDTLLVILSLEGHPLVLPIGHVARLADVDGRSAAAMLPLAARVAEAMRAATGCEGMNLILSDGRLAGQDVPHVHLHVKPRWEADGVRIEWDTRTAPDASRLRLAEGLRSELRPV